MNQVSVTFITLGALLLIGLATDFIGRKTSLPRVTLLLLAGVILGPSGLSLLPSTSSSWFPIITDIALLLVGFLMGGKLAHSFLRQNGRVILWLSLSEVIITIAVITIGLILLGVSLEAALLLAGIAAATDPAATTDVINETGARGPFTDTLTGVVAIDDAWSLVAFSMLLAVAQTISGQGNAYDVLLHGVWELGGSILLGIILGLPMAYLSGRVRPGQPTLVEALGIVFLCGGLAHWFNLSYILTAMVLGATVANFAKHHERPFHAIEDIEWPIMILFFVLAGSSLQLMPLFQIGLVGCGYISLRIVARFLGSWPGGILAGANTTIKCWLGLSLLPQAGIAMGMALIAVNKLPELQNIIFPVVIGATILFEFIGPIATKVALSKANEICVSPP